MIGHEQKVFRKKLIPFSLHENYEHVFVHGGSVCSTFDVFKRLKNCFLKQPNRNISMFLQIDDRTQG